MGWHMLLLEKFIFLKKRYFFLIVLFLSLSFGVAYATTLGGEGSSDEGELVHRMVLLVFQLSIIIFAARLGGSIFKRYHLPSLLGEIMAGSIIGPSLLGSIPFPGFAHGFFPHQGSFPVSLELYSFATVASIVLLFLVGLETDIEMFLNCSLAGSVVGIGGVVVSFILGDVAFVFLAPYFLEGNFSVTDPVPLFMGVISTATSVGISARILSEKRKMDSVEGVTIISGAVIDDVLGIIVLAIVLGVVRSGEVQWKQVANIAGKAIGVWLVFTAIGLYFAGHISRYLKKFRDKDLIAIMGLACALFMAGIFEKSGLAMIIGAYIMGLSLSKTDLSLVIQEHLSSLYCFLIPIFFCVMGMLVNFQEMFSPKILVFGLIYMIFAVLGKIVGCSFPALFLNFNFRGAMRIGMGMVPRGEVALIIAGIGLSAGIIGEDIFSIAMIMTFMTTFLTPPLFSKMLDSDKPILRKEKEVSRDYHQIIYTMPNVETADLILSKVVEAFEGEGFYVHTFHMQQGFYQIRKGQTFISMKYSPEKIIFDCLEKDAAFVHTLFYEVFAELEKIMRNLQQVTDKEKIGNKIFEGEIQTHKQVSHITSVINPKTVEISLKGKSKDELIKEMVQFFVHAGELTQEQAGAALLDVLKREETMSTGMQKGIALPHAKTTAVPKMMCAVGLKKEGINFDSLDKKPAKIFIMTLTPREAQESYLQFMAEISKCLMNKENYQKIMSSTSSEDLYSVLTSASFS
ncbi:cation:proton antiporter [Candidatus Auribacterota bacterium]